MITFILAVISVPWCHNINQLLFLRFIQGTSIALTIVPIRAVLLDLFTGRELYKMMNYMSITWSIGPIIAPAIGGYLQYYLGWKANFYFLASYSIILLMLILKFMPETAAHYHSFRLKPILENYRTILSCLKFDYGLLSNGILYSLIILFSVVGPFLIQVELKYSSIHFGYISLLLGTAWF